MKCLLWFQKLPDTIFCADSLSGFRHILGQSGVKNSIPEIKSEGVIDSEIKAVKEIFEAEDPYNVVNEGKLLCPNWTSYDDVLLETLVAFESRGNTPEKVQSWEGKDYKSLCEEKIHHEAGNFLEGESYYLKKILETTPKTSGQLTYSTEKVEINSVLPEQEMKETVRTGSRVRKRLFKAEEKDGDSNKILKRFRLCDIYLHLFDRDPIEAHRAENDALNLMQCIVAKSPRFLEWVDQTAKPLNTVKSLLS